MRLRSLKIHIIHFDPYSLPIGLCGPRYLPDIMVYLVLMKSIKSETFSPEYFFSIPTSFRARKIQVVTVRKQRMARRIRYHFPNFIPERL